MVPWNPRERTSGKQEWATSLYASRWFAIVVHFSSLEVNGDLDKIDLGGVVSTENRLERTEE